MSTLNPKPAYPKDAGNRRSFRSLAAMVVAAMVAALVSVVGIAAPAAAAAGDYSVDLTGPDSVDVGSSFTYTVVVDAEATPGDPAEGIVLTLQLDSHLDVDTVATGGTSPAESWEYDQATGVLTVTLKDVTDSLSSFAIAVTQKNIAQLDPTSTFTTSVTGTETPSGGIPEDSHTADVTGDVTFDTEKRMTPQPGTGNRVVLYPFHISEGVGSARFASSMQELVDELAVGAEVIASSAGPGEWTFEGDASTGITATWNHVGTVLNNGQMPTRAGDVWLRVRYPEAAFPEGTVPPVNTVVLSVEDQAGVRYEALAQDSVQPLEVTSGAPVPQAALTKTFVPGAVNNGTRVRADLSVYYADGGQGVDAEAVVLEDVGSFGDNADFFQGLASEELRFNWNAILQAADVPVRVEVQFDGGAWEVADDTRTTGQGQYRVLFRADGVAVGGVAGRSDLGADGGGRKRVHVRPFGVHRRARRIDRSAEHRLGDDSGRGRFDAER